MKSRKRLAILLAMMVVGSLIPGCFLCADFHMSEAPFPKIKSSTDPEAIQRGAYLVHNVAHCSTCHAPGDKISYGNFVLSDTLSGGYNWKIPLFGSFTAANITPDNETGIGNHTDEELARAIRHGVRKNGLFAPFMALSVGPMADEDLSAIISWLRAQKPVKSPAKPDEFGLLAKFLRGKWSYSKAKAPPYVPPGGVSIERGRYLAEGPAACKICHSTADPMAGFAIVGAPFAGNTEAEPDPLDDTKVILAPNLTPHEGTGHISTWTEDAFVARFKAGRVIKGSKMPWEGFMKMTEEDLRSIYQFLRTLQPVEQAIGVTWRKKD